MITLSGGELITIAIAILVAVGGIIGILYKDLQNQMENRRTDIKELFVEVNRLKVRMAKLDKGKYKSPGDV